MKLSLRNVGKIAEAEVEIKGITVIAGENNTGKSTIGKSLYCLFKAFNNIDEKIEEERIRLVRNAIRFAFLRKDRDFSIKGFYKIAEEICSKKEFYVEEKEQLRETLKNYYFSIANDENEAQYNATKAFEKVLSYLQLSDESIKINVLRSVLSEEFNGQIGNIEKTNSSCSIHLSIHADSIDVRCDDSDKIAINNSINIYSKIVYIEDPFVIDELAHPAVFLSRNGNRRASLEFDLARRRNDSLVGDAIEEAVVLNKLEHIFSILNGVCDGTLTPSENGFSYNSKRYQQPLSVANISTGLKTFLILKTLLLNGSIESEGTIILDEPEIHLHPQWQLIFAELIVLLQKEFGMHILLNTHSPYFLRAIQVYAGKYEIADQCKYYLSEADGNMAVIKDVSDNIELIYDKLYKPLQDLENLRAEL